MILRHVALVVTAAAFGIIFGLGLILSHMTDPARVAGFLDIAGAWNPALAFVMGGAVVVAAPAFWLARRRRSALLGTRFELPNRFAITWQLVLGAAVFGLGWGLSGICPGPALVLLSSLAPQVLVFVAALIAGIVLADQLKR
ncbi:hypothetical protein FHS83_003077 [Rhizomicrobium palustre]|uniref:YeeE/YedE family protein n=1 Tax=Rhizomicrobium palustre TaxID=189966 RepID=A0A846N2M0_9PROT|nr:DUF6691 family protein [Rhizomicrobium palustre]NIK89759.1 hypothetical protein [Rhizomicrobium palustre]